MGRFIKLLYYTNKNVCQWFFSNLLSQTFANSQQLVYAVSVNDSLARFTIVERKSS